jgi:hypothetical protein
MYSPPYIFFHSPVGCRWADGTDPALQKLHTINDAPNDLLPSLTINVSKPDALMTWLGTNNAARISNLSIFLDATSLSPSPQQWCRLFDKLQREATDIIIIIIKYSMGVTVESRTSRSPSIRTRPSHLRCRQDCTLASYPIKFRKSEKIVVVSCIRLSIRSKLYNLEIYYSLKRDKFKYRCYI